MIQDQDRSGWFGASDVGFIMGNWKTKTFQAWWMKKLGLNRDHFTNTAMAAGTYYEHAILDAIGAKEKDRQIILPELLLRVNLDGSTDEPGKFFIHEVKTHKWEKPYKPTLQHTRQVNVQIFAARLMGRTEAQGEIVSYGLTEEDYKNFFRDIDTQRLKHHPIAYDTKFIGQFIPRLEYLGDCLKKGRWPDEIPH